MRFADWMCWLMLVASLGIGQAVAAAGEWPRWADEVASGQAGVDQEFEAIIDPDEPLQPVPGGSETVVPDSAWGEVYESGEWTEYDEGYFDDAWQASGCATCGSPHCGGKRGDGHPCETELPNWFFSSDALLMNRQRPRLKNLTFDQALTTVLNIQGNEIEILRWVLTTRSARFGFEPGNRTTIGRVLDRDMLDRVHSIEFNYLGFFEWDTSARVRATERLTFENPPIVVEGGSLFGPFPMPGSTGGFDFSDEHEIRYGSDLNSFELNYRLRRSMPPDHLCGSPDGTWTQTPSSGHTPSMYAGLRYLKFDERFSFRSIGLLDVNDVTFVNAADYSVDTHNELAGFQIGGDLIDDHVWWSWGLRGNIGAYVNWAQQESRLLFDAEAFANRENQIFGDRDVTGALVGEFGVVATYRPQPHVALRAAFDLMWIQGLALAPEQLVFSYPPSAQVGIGTGGHLLFQGFSLGMEVEW